MKAKDNTQCSGNSMLNADFCYFHNPAIPEADKSENRAIGGKNNAIGALEPLEPLDIQAPQDVVTLLIQTINQVRGGKIEIRAANCLGVLSSHLLRAFEMSDLEKRIEKIEQSLKQRV